MLKFWKLSGAKILWASFLVCLALFLMIAGFEFFLKHQIRADYQRNYQTSAEKASQLLSEDLGPLLQIAKVDAAYSTRTLQKIRDSVFSVEVGSSAYLILLDKAGVFLHHPNRDWGLASVHASRYFPAEATRAIEETLKNSQRKFVRYTDRGQVFWLFLEPLSEKPFFMGLVCSESELTELPDAQRFALLRFLSGSFALILGISLLLELWRFSRVEIKRLSWLFSLALLANLGYAWYLQIHVNPSPVESQSLGSPTDLTRYRALLQIHGTGSYLPDPILVPTGLRIRSLSFEKPDIVRISGYYWQKFPRWRRGMISPESKGIFFPEAREVRFRDAFSRLASGYELSGQYFELVLQQGMNHSHYPLNRETVNLHFSVPEQAENIALIPDLDAYPKATKPGLDTALRIDGWDIYASAFHYLLTDRHPLSELHEKSEGQVPELNLKIYVRRSFWGVVILNLIYVGMVLLLLFWVLIRTTSAYYELYRPLDIFGPAMGLLFPLLFAQSNLHLGVIGVERLFYLDYFYFMVYLAIVLVSAHFLFWAPQKATVLNREDGILVKSMYWPLILGCLELVTLTLFW
ncbi:hypothetical protein COW36_00305 [bacterium (Candidatus Blackallbacteria) CG17_big_fil_post_rev_8_21_14_2_50_48_46]|uniref:Double Cache domain-containing protein n=1 Tax=bacterium (Candidatus Blackallbacteria) CG17_big_fil_post_rev_8_21_14_2_50_48_46 TaxID=2014261 RepID=A0A2M7GAV3_9BACT|nr:MAG: hypothetical protein COW64_10865 [bacterium (Candidatus Blackallbacteria) CG18_big_fil_WC_8_21_14_2_50_49_26]PIW19316.1 MAG: hypothetical protein COW36_00305 [bacterium (Candidatus Blackallbacteria) CG17_big_fil_post_rev_8_21_14_2_50_48_46]PIW49080.1 MAG: hypothetical protein COW20_08150 [bacterium (Candidatus Blackallbacteria) CG13_big_fil_rev_8_21_14_2_50_49_14]